jgi:ubiquinone/menaquinone biosynthesis C-methylase UbiE
MSGIEESVLSELLHEDVNLKLVEPHIYSVLFDINVDSSYDKKFGDFYDWVACNPIYNRLIWGYSISKLASLTFHALTSSERGYVLDLGCGSLAFTAKKCAQYSERPVIFFDQSLKLLKMARTRVAKIRGSIPGNMVFLQGDAFQLPFRPHCFETIISLNMLHVIRDLKKVLLCMKKVLSENGRLSLTTLVENNRISDRYLKMWENAGELVCRNIMQLNAVLDDLRMPMEHHVVGNMAFMSYTKKECRHV